MQARPQHTLNEMTDTLDVTDKTLKVALITGVGGQDGFFLARQLWQRGYKVHGISRAKTSAWSKTNVEVSWHVGDVQSSDFMQTVLR